jgi:hypothetical protein
MTSRLTAMIYRVCGKAQAFVFSWTSSNCTRHVFVCVMRAVNSTVSSLKQSVFVLARINHKSIRSIIVFLKNYESFMYGSLRKIKIRVTRNITHCTVLANTFADTQASRDRATRTAEALSRIIGPGTGERSASEAVCLLTRPMYERLSSPPGFVRAFLGETETPELVWGQVNRKELGQFVKHVFEGINVLSPKPQGYAQRQDMWTPSYKPDNAVESFQFTNIRRLTLVGGLYLEVRAKYVCLCMCMSCMCLHVH